MIAYQFIVTVFLIYGIHASTREDMIFSFLWRWVFIGMTRMQIKPTHVLKPLFDCTPCMASVWGTIAFWVWELPYGFLGWLTWVFTLAGFNYLINKLINR